MHGNISGIYLRNDHHDDDDNDYDHGDNDDDNEHNGEDQNHYDHYHYHHHHCDHSRGIFQIYYHAKSRAPSLKIG